MPPKVIFRCDAGDAPEIGTGHIARSKTLASAIVKHGLVKQEDIFFYTRDDEGFNLGKKYLASSGIQFQELSGNKLKANSKSEKDILINTEAKLIFFDRLETSKDIVSNIQKEGIKVVTFDDYGSGRNYVDLAISAIFDDVNKSLNLVTGYEYLILSKDFYSCGPIKANVQNLVATFGGNDARDICSHFIKHLHEIPCNIQVDIILGKVNNEALIKYRKDISSIVSGDNIKLHVFPQNYHEIISNADVAISSGGLSIFEFAAYGVPTIGLPQYQHQLRTIENLQNAGISILGTDGMNLSSTKISSALKYLIQDHVARKQMAEKSRKCIDGNGIERIIELLNTNFKDIFYE
tara:strand:+ start:3780 stop:4829 length:1050 start_codon:yes stop_codon:yes gene_type:complete